MNVLPPVVVFGGVCCEMGLNKMFGVGNSSGIDGTVNRVASPCDTRNSL